MFLWLNSTFKLQTYIPKSEKQQWSVTKYAEDTVYSMVMYKQKQDYSAETDWILQDKLVFWEVKPVKHEAQAFKAGSAQWDGLRTHLMCRWDTRPWTHTARCDPTPWPQTSTLQQPGKRRGTRCHKHISKTRNILETLLCERLHCWTLHLLSWFLQCIWLLQWHCGHQDSWWWVTDREQKRPGCQRCQRCQSRHHRYF